MATEYCGVTPQNQLSFLSSVVPVLPPASWPLEGRAALPVPLSITTSMQSMAARATSLEKTRSPVGSVLSTMTLPLRSSIFTMHSGS